MFVEGKLNAPTSRKQVADYLKVRRKWFPEFVRRDARVHVALIANKALIPRDRTASERWLGAVTWVDLLEELQGLEFKSPERVLRWRTLLELYRDAGAFGAYRENVDDLGQALNALVLRSVAELNRGLSRRRGRAIALPWDEYTEDVVRRIPGGGAAMRLSVRFGSSRRARELEVRLRHDRQSETGVRVTLWAITRGSRIELASAFSVADQLQEQIPALVLQAGRTLPTKV